MNTHPRPLTLSLSLCAALAWTFASTAAQASVSSVIVSDTNAYYGAISDAIQDSSPSGLNPWPAVPVPLPTATFLGSVPAIPSSIPAPTGANPFAPTAAFTFFNPASGNFASSSLLGFAAGGNSVDDAQMTLSMTLIDNGGYAYEQLNYDIDYGLTNTAGSGAISGALAGLVTRSFSVTGNVGSAPGSFAQFGGEMNFWEEPSNTFLGQVTFNYLNNTLGSIFSTTVTGSSFIGTGALNNPINNPEFIRITGDFFLYGDPSQIIVESIPEPSALSLLGIAGLGLLKRARRHP